MAVLIPSSTSVTNVGYLHASATSSFTRPSDTAAYAVGDLVGNSTTAASVVPMSFVSSRIDSGCITIDRVKISKTGTSVTNASFRLHLFSTLPGVASGDNASLSLTGAASYLGSMDIAVNQAFTDGSAGFSDNTPKVIRTKLPSGYTVYGILEARAAYTPTSAEVFTVSLDVVQG